MIFSCKIATFELKCTCLQMGLWGAYTMQTRLYTVEHVRTRREPKMLGCPARVKKLRTTRNINIDIFKHYGHYSHDACHNGTLWQGLSDHHSLSDFHPRSRSQGLIDSIEISNIDIFSESMTTAVAKLCVKVLGGLAFCAIPVSKTFIQVHGHKGWWKILSNWNI